MQADFFQIKRICNMSLNLQGILANILDFQIS